MMPQVFRHRIALPRLYVLAFFLGFAVAFPAYIHSTYLTKFLPVERVGYFFLVAMGVTLIVTNAYPPIVRRIGNFAAGIFSLIIAIGSIVALLLTSSIVVAFVAFTGFMLFSRLMSIAMDVFIESASTDKDTGGIRGKYLTATDMAWLFTPLIVGAFVADGGYEAAYIGGIILLAVTMLILVVSRTTVAGAIHYPYRHLFRTLRNVWNTPSLRTIHIIALLLRIFYTIMVLYMPIYLFTVIGFSWPIIGAIFSFMLLPFPLIRIPAGTLADRYIGEKELMVVGFLILTVATLMVGLSSSANPLVWGGLLFFTRVGAALVESMQETYFFKQVDQGDVDYISLLRTTEPLGYIVAVPLAIILLASFSLPTLFFTLAILMVPGIFLGWSLRDTR